MTQLADDLEELRLPDLRDRFLAVVGEPTRCPNKTYLIRRIREVLAERRACEAEAPIAAATPSPASEPRKLDTIPAPPPAPKTEVSAPRGRFASMTIEELQQKYLEAVGRPTSSENRTYLKWKIREAERGRIPTGPRAPRTPGPPRPMRVLPLRIEVEAIERMDAAWRSHGIRSRTAFLKKALGEYLVRLGAGDAAELIQRGA